MYDVAWSESENRWVARHIRFRWVGDVFFERDKFPNGRVLAEVEQVCAAKNAAGKVG